MMVEAVGLLNSLTPADAMETLRSLRGYKSAPKILSILRQAANRVSHDDPKPADSSSTFLSDLEDKHSFAYPKISESKTNDLKKHLRGLLAPRDSNSTDPPFDVDALLFVYDYSGLYLAASS